jgi:hypothetical protein
VLVRGSSSVTLTQYIIVFGAFNLIVSQFPHFHSLRFVNTIATFSTISFSIIAVGLSLYAGALLFVFSGCSSHPACFPVSTHLPPPSPISITAVELGLYAGMRCIHGSWDASYILHMLHAGMHAHWGSACTRVRYTLWITFACLHACWACFNVWCLGCLWHP